MAQDLQTIVQRMVEAGEPEDAIRLVIENYKSVAPTETPVTQPVAQPVAQAPVTPPITEQPAPIQQPQQQPKKPSFLQRLTATALGGGGPVDLARRANELLIKPAIEPYVSKMVPQLAGEEPGFLNPNLEQNPALLKSWLPETKAEPGIVGGIRHGLYEGLVRPTASPLGLYSAFAVGNPAEIDLPPPRLAKPNIGAAEPPLPIKPPISPNEMNIRRNPQTGEVWAGDSPTKVPFFEEAGPEPPLPIKPNVRANLDQTFTDKATGQVLDKAGNPIEPFNPASLQGLEPAKPTPSIVGQLIPEKNGRPLPPKMGSIEGEAELANSLRQAASGKTTAATPETLPVKPSEVTPPTSGTMHWSGRKGKAPKQETVDLNTGEILTRRVDPSKLSNENRSFIDQLSDENLKDFISRQEKNPNYQQFTGKDMLDYARDSLDERAANPAINISTKLPPKPSSTNMTPENVADIEAWYRFKKLFDSGKIKDDPTDPLMIEWAKVHNRVKDLKPDGSVEIRPNRFDTLPLEEPEFTPYVLPDGTKVNLSTSATKGAETTTFQLKGGEIVTAKKATSPEFEDVVGFDLPPKSKVAESGSKPPIPPEKPPVTTGGELPPETPKTPKSFLEGQPEVSTGLIVPENVGVTSAADEVTTSLSQRLQKAIDNEGTPNAVAPEEISKLLDEAAEVLAKNPGAKDTGIIRQILGANKALLTSWDLSAPGRQGKALILNKAWWTSLDDMVKAWGSKEAADLVNQSIITHPSGYFQRGVSATGKPTKSFAEKIGLDLASTEEMFKTTLGQGFEKYAGIGKATRAHTAFLNKLRSDQFVSMMDAAKKAGLDPENNLVLAKAYATFINDATGRGSVNIGKWKLERNVNVLNDVFFAPKNMAGQIRTWNNVLNPVKYYNYDPVLRKQALRSLFAVAGMGLGVGELARQAGAKVSNDSTNADFRKIRIGDTRIDPFGGYQQFPVAAMKFMIGQSTSSISGKTTDLTAGKFGQQTRSSVAERFFINRLSPIGSFIYAWMSNREFDGKPFEEKRALYERVFPIAMKDIYELAQEDPALAAMLGPATVTGLIGTQHYTGR